MSSSFCDRAGMGVSCATVPRSLSVSSVAGISCSLAGLDVRISVGDETLARFFNGDVPMTLGEMEFRNTFGDGRDEVGLAILAADDSNCVWPKS